ncbi:MAG: MBL fold metallo-hydrolase [Pseudomonadales bacterium]
MSRTQRRLRLSLLLGGLLAGFSAGIAVAAQADRFADVEITASRISGSVYMLTGAGGNIGASVGPDGTMIIDDQFAPLAERIQTALNGLGGGKPRLVLNTHFHGDHTGSNAHFGVDGTVIAHDNVRVRLLESEGVTRAALPLVTYADRIQVHFNDDDIELIHLPHGHTDSDSIVWFKNANVVHLGDHLFNGGFPFIDIASGGSVDGYVANLESVLKMLPSDIQIIPGHGALAGITAVSESVRMIHDTQDTVKAGLAAGKSTDEIVAAGLDARWESFGSGFINEERWIRILLSDL